MLKDTPKIESPTVTLDRATYNEVQKQMAQFSTLQGEFLSTLNELNEMLATTISIKLPNGDYLDFRSNFGEAHVLMEGLAQVLKTDRYPTIKADLLKIGRGQK